MTDLSNRLRILRDEYPGDKAWEKFVSCFPEIDDSLANQVSIDPDFIRALYWKKGDNIDRVISWLNSPVPALDNWKPVEVLDLDQGKIVLRTAVMRMP